MPISSIATHTTGSDGKRPTARPGGPPRPPDPQPAPEPISPSLPQGQSNRQPLPVASSETFPQLCAAEWCGFDGHTRLKVNDGWSRQDAVEAPLACPTTAGRVQMHGRSPAPGGLAEASRQPRGRSLEPLASCPHQLASKFVGSGVITRTMVAMRMDVAKMELPAPEKMCPCIDDDPPCSQTVATGCRCCCAGFARALLASGPAGSLPPGPFLLAAHPRPWAGGAAPGCARSAGPETALAESRSEPSWLAG